MWLFLCQIAVYTDWAIPKIEVRFGFAINTSCHIELYCEGEKRTIGVPRPVFCPVSYRPCRIRSRTLDATGNPTRPGAEADALRANLAMICRMGTGPPEI